MKQNLLTHFTGLIMTTWRMRPNLLPHFYPQFPPRKEPKRLLTTQDCGSPKGKRWKENSRTAYAKIQRHREKNPEVEEHLSKYLEAVNRGQNVLEEPD